MTTLIGRGRLVLPHQVTLAPVTTTQKVHLQVGVPANQSCVYTVLDDFCLLFDLRFF